MGPSVTANTLIRIEKKAARNRVFFYRHPRIEAFSQSWFQARVGAGAVLGWVGTLASPWVGLLSPLIPVEPSRPNLFTRREECAKLHK
jgi:hypothetical protein